MTEFEQKIRSQSVFKHLKSWKLIHFIVKTGSQSLIILRRRPKTRIIRPPTPVPNPTNLQPREPGPTPLALLRSVPGPKLRCDRVPQGDDNRRFAQIEIEGAGHGNQYARIL